MYIVRIWEGLGNQMFQYAFARAVKYKTNQTVYLDTNRTYRKSFQWEQDVTKRKYDLEGFSISLDSMDIKTDKRFCFLAQDTMLHKIEFFLSKIGLFPIHFLDDYDVKEMNCRKFIHQSGDYYVMGWFQNEDYFKGIRSILLKEFSPCKKIELAKHEREIIENPQSVAVHVRRGDYKKINHLCSLNYYYKAMNYMKEKLDSPYFVFFSDDIDWAKKVFVNVERAVFFDGKNRYRDFEELCIMSRCRHQIISNSTFSWWGAWLNQNVNKVVIAPDNWFPRQKNIIPPEWVQISQQKAIKVLVVLNCAYLYGANRSILDLVDGMRGNERPVSFCFLLPEKGQMEGELRKRKLKYWIVSYKQNIKDKTGIFKDLKNQIWNLRLAIKMLPSLKKQKIDIIHTNSSNIDFGAVLGALSGTKHIWHFRELLQEHYHLNWVFPQLQRWYMTKADAVIYISNAVKQKYTSPKIREYVVYNGVVKKSGVNIRFESEKRVNRVYDLICAGVIMEGKGQMDAVRAVHQVLKETDYKLHLRIVGGGQPGYINQIKKYIKKNQIEENIEILPYQKDLSEIRQKSDIAIITSRSEGLGRVTIESMGEGLLTIGADSGATTEIIREGITGYLYGVGNSSELARKIETAIECIECGLDEEIRKNAKQFVIEKFECNRQAEKVYGIYKNVMR